MCRAPDQWLIPDPLPGVATAVIDFLLDFYTQYHTTFGIDIANHCKTIVTPSGSIYCYT